MHSEMQSGKWPVEPYPANPHPDDILVDKFATLMKAKMKEAREVQGKGGWDDSSVCSLEYLEQLLLIHASIGKPVNIANYAMMVHFRREIEAAGN